MKKNMIALGVSVSVATSLIMEENSAMEQPQENSCDKSPQYLLFRQSFLIVEYLKKKRKKKKESRIKVLEPLP